MSTTVVAGRAYVNNMTTTLEGLVPEWLIHLEAESKSPKTLSAYRYAGDQFAAFLRDRDLSTEVAAITARHVEAFLVAKAQETSASTAATRYRGLQQFFRWAIDEGEIEKSPMATLRPPKVATAPVPVIPDDALARLFKACEGNTFDARRDVTIFRLMLSTGARLNEVAQSHIADVDLQHRELRVVGKGRKSRDLPLSPKTTRALLRYLRIRAGHPWASDPRLFIGLRGPVTDSGITQILRRRCREAGIDQLHPHQFRHTFAHVWLAKGGNEHDLAKLAGWESLQMVARYGASAAVQRAKEAHKLLLVGDDF